MNTTSPLRGSAPKAGVLSLREARAAARIAKAERPSGSNMRDLPRRGSAAWELYLGRFGASVKMRVIEKSRAKKSASKNAATETNSEVRKKR